MSDFSDAFSQGFQRAAGGALPAIARIPGILKKGVDVFSNYWSGLADAMNPHVEPVSTGKLASEAAFPDLGVDETDPLWSKVPMVGPFAGARSAFEKQTPIRSVAKGVTEAGTDIATDPTTMMLGASGISNPAVNLGFKLQMGYGAGQHAARVIKSAQEKGIADPETLEEIGKSLPDVAMAYAPHGAEESSTDREVSSDLEKQTPNVDEPTTEPEPSQKAVARTERDIAPIAKHVEKWPEYKAAENVVNQGIADAAPHVKNDIIPDADPSSPGGSELVHGILGSRTEQSGKIRVNLVEHAINTNSPKEFAHLVRTTVEHELAHPGRPHGDKQVGTDADGNPYVMDSDGKVAIVPRNTKPGYAYEDRAKFDPDEMAFTNALDAVRHHPGVVDALNDMEDRLASSDFYDKLRSTPVPEAYKGTPESSIVSRKGQMAVTPPKSKEGLIADQLELIEEQGGEDHPFFQKAFEEAKPPEPDTTLEDFGHRGKDEVSEAEAEPEAIANFRKSQERKYGSDWRLKQTAQEARFYDKLQDDAANFVSLPGAKAAGEKPTPQYAFDKSVKQPNGDTWRHILQHDGTLRIERYDKAGNLYAAHEGPDLDSMEPVEIGPEDLRPPIPPEPSAGGGKGPPSEPPEKPPSGGEESPEDDGEADKRIYKVRLTNGEYVRIKGISEEDAINKINEQLEKIDMTHVSAESAQGLLTPLERAALGEPGFEQQTKDIGSMQKKLDTAPASAEAQAFETHIKSQMDRVKLEEKLEAAQAREEYKKVQAEMKARERDEAPPAEKSALGKAADIVSGSKRAVMSSGIPYTAVSPHGFSIMGRQVLTSNPLEAPGEALNAVKAMISPSARDITKIYAPEQIAEMQSMGLLKNLEDYTAPKPESTGPWDNIKDIHKDMFEKPLFGKGGYAQYVEARVYTRRKAELLESGLPAEAAAKQAADDARVAVGNVRLFAKDGTLNDLSRIALFAPNWLASQGRIGAGMVNALLSPTDPRGKMFRNVLINYAALTAGKEALSYALNGKNTFQNGTGHRTDVSVGKDSNGKDVFVRPEANSADSFRIAIDLADALANDPKKAWEVADSHIAPMTRAFMHLIQDRDHFGNHIYSTDRFGRPLDASTAVRNVVNELSQMTPSWFQAGVKSVEHIGEPKVKAPSVEEIGAKAIGLPISFKSPQPGPQHHEKQFPTL